MLNLYRRHRKTCEHRAEGVEYLKCGCPITCRGVDANGKHIRLSLKTCDMQRALRRVEQLERPNAQRSDLIPCAQPGCNIRVESGRCEKHRKLIPEAIQAFHDSNPDIGRGTKRSYKRTLQYLEAHASASKLVYIDQIEPGDIDRYRATRSIMGTTWTKELGTLRGFFGFCVDRNWTVRNPASKVKTPKNIKPAEKEPYTHNELVKILAACDSFGRSTYERLRGRAMVLLFRYTALRVSDVAPLARDSVRDGEIRVRTLKNGKTVWLPVPPDLQKALDVLPVPRGTPGESTYFFWSGNGKIDPETGEIMTDAVIRDAKRMMAAIFKKAGVKGSPHRYRHTLASELLANGVGEQDVADILGDEVKTIRKHYAKWMRKRQDRISAIMREHFFQPNAAPEADARYTGGTRQ
jgi:integrase